MTALWLVNRKIIYPLLLLLIASFLLFSYKITDIPPGINGDEASIGYNAILLSQTFRDENSRLLPIFTLTMNGKDWKQPVTMYLTAFLFRLFGPSYFLLRFISVMFITTTLIFIFFILKELATLKMALIGVLIFITTPIVMIQSHLALENIAPLPFVAFWLLMLVRFEKTRKLKLLLYAGISLGISFYSYNGMRLTMPVFTFLTIFYILLLYRLSLKNSIPAIKFFILGLLPFLLLIPWVNYKYPGALFANNQPVKILSYQDFLMPYLSTFDLSFLFLTGDSTPYHSTGKHGVYLLVTLPFFLLGCFRVLKYKSYCLILILAAFFLSPVLFGFVGSIHRGSRLLSMVPFFVILTSLGINWLFNLSNFYFKNVVIVSVVVLFFLNFGDFLKYYWFEYPQVVKNHFSGPIHRGFENMAVKSNVLSLTPYIESGIYQHEILAAKFFGKIYFPKPLEKWTLGTKIPDNSIVFVRVADALTLESKGMKRIDLDVAEYGLVFHSK